MPVFLGLAVEHFQEKLSCAPALFFRILPRLPLSCWILATLAAGSMAVEFCMVYFGAELLTSAGLGTAQAAIAMSAFYLGSLGGRVGGAWLTRRAGRSVRCLRIAGRHGRRVPAVLARRPAHPHDRRAVLLRVGRRQSLASLACLDPGRCAQKC